MQATINEIITGDYNHLGEACIYGDSVTGDTIIRTSNGEFTIESLFNQCLEFSKTTDGKEYGLWLDLLVHGFNGYEMEAITSPIECIMRHKTKKKLYRITTENGKQVTVTEDHSLIVDRDGFLTDITVNQLLPTDLIITL